MKKIKISPSILSGDFSQLGNEIQKLEKNYTINEPEQFLAMYDAIRENSKDRK